MATKEDLQEWIIDALESKAGAAELLDVSKHVWAHHEGELRSSGDLFYTWQYDLRWAATKLRKAGRLAEADDCPRGVWQLA